MTVSATQSSSSLNGGVSESCTSCLIAPEDQQDDVRAGYGSCMSCKCKGYVKPGDNSAICANPACRHHWSQHY